MIAQPEQVQYVMINNQVVPVQVVNQGQFQTHSGFIAPPYGQYQQPPSGIPVGIVQQNAFVPQSNVFPIQQSGVAPVNVIDEYTNNVVCYTVTYLFFFIGCIGVQYGLYGSLTAARLWISSYVFLIVTLILFFMVRRAQVRLLLLLLIFQIFFLILSFVLEIAAFTTAVQHPVLYDYEKNQSSESAIYNNRRRLYVYTYSECYDYYTYYSPSDYQQYYGDDCNEVLGFNSGSQYSYSECSNYYNSYSISTYRTYYAEYCDSVLGIDSNSYYTYSQCKQFYDYSSSSTYQYYYAQYCDSVLGYSNTTNTSTGLISGHDTYSTYAQSCSNLYDYYYSSYKDYEYICDPLLGYYISPSEFDYSRCARIYEAFTYSTYQSYYSQYCDTILGLDESGYSPYDDGNQCTGYYDPLKDYCFPLQKGMLAYEILNFIAYLILFGGLFKRISNFYKHVKRQPQIQPLQYSQPFQYGQQLQ